MNNGYKGTIVVSLVMSLILLLVAVLVWPNKTTIENVVQSNEINKKETQIEIIVKRINIREEAKIDSKDIGDVFNGEVYTVLEDVETEDYYWYKIKTSTNITGYIASSKEDEYVKLISGYIDRTPPVINYDKDYYVFYNGVEEYNDITCTDEYSTCSINIDRDNLYVTITATDEKGNKSEKKMRFFDIYDGGNYFTERNYNLSIDYSKTLNSDNSMYLTATYVMNKMIKSENKSNSYNINVNLFDENFNIINEYHSKYNSVVLDNECKNDKGMNIKEEYLNENLEVGDKLCFNYYIPDHTKVKYFEVSISGLDNTDKADNYLSNYSSRLIVK